MRRGERLVFVWFDFFCFGKGGGGGVGGRGMLLGRRGGGRVCVDGEGCGGVGWWVGGRVNGWIEGGKEGTKEGRRGGVVTSDRRMLEVRWNG